MRIFQCVQPLALPCHDRQGNPVAGKEITIPAGVTFTAGDDQGEMVRLEGLRGLRLTVSQQTLQAHFEELT